MKTKQFIRFAILISIVLLIAAGCTGGFAGIGGNSDNTGKEGNGNDQIVGQNGANEDAEIVQAFDRGVIAQKSENGERYLITQYIPKEDTSHVEAMWLDISETTRFEDQAGNSLSTNDFQIGQQVSVSITGMVRESYPTQADAAKIVLLDAETQGMPIAENDAFRLFSPFPMQNVSNTFTVTGEARVFEAAFLWTLEDGHDILAEGSAMADHGAPEWGKFQFDVTLDKEPTGQPMLVLYVASAKDGSIEHELMIPISLEEN